MEFQITHKTCPSFHWLKNITTVYLLHHLLLILNNIMNTITSTTQPASNNHDYYTHAHVLDTE